MPINLTMPALSPTMEEGVLASWLVKEGDRVETGDVIAEIETDKATMEFEAPDSGTLARIVVPADGKAVAVNTLIAILVDESEDLDALADDSDVSAAVASEAPSGGPQATDVPVDSNIASQQRVGDRVFASPLARRIAKDAGIELSSVLGSGPRGRIVRKDVESAKSAATATAGQPQVSALAQSQEVDLSAFKEGTFEVVELDTMRKVIARRLTESKQTVPHFYLRADVELDALLALRSQLNAATGQDEAGKPAYKISVNDFVIKALALSMRDNPDANVTWANGSILRHKSVDVSVAVAIEGGLITPVVRDADALSLSTLSNRMKDLAARARDRKLAPDEFQGGSTSVSNLGMFGVSSFDAVINPPQGTIMAVGAGEKRPVVRGEELAVATVMTATLSVDHRVVDGALGAEVLRSFKTYLENPLTLLV